MTVRHAIFNFSTNLTDEKRGLSKDWDLGILAENWGKRKVLPLGMGPIFDLQYWQTRVLIWIQTVCKGYQQTTQAGKEPNRSGFFLLIRKRKPHL